MFLHAIDNETSLSYSAIQNDISFPESSGGTYINEWQQGGNVEPCDSELSSVSSSSESEDDESMEHSKTHSNSPDPRGSNEPVLHPAVSSGDFGKVVQLKARRKVTDHEKLFLLTKHFIPPHNYKFPARFVSGHNRHFQQSWLDQHNGLVYSESEDGGYCKYCVLFAQDGPGMELGVLVNRPLIDYKRASEKLCDHFRHKQFHKASLEAAATFTSVMKNPDLAVDHQLSSERSVQLKII